MNHIPMDGQEQPGLLRRRHLWWICRGLLLLALLNSIYLMLAELMHVELPGCGPISDCYRVLHSPWKRAIGVPLSCWGFAFYLLWFAATMTRHRYGKIIRLASAGVLFVGFIWLILLQAWLISAFCPFCVIGNGLGLLASLLVLWLDSARPLDMAWPAIGLLIGCLAVGGHILTVTPYSHVVLGHEYDDDHDAHKQDHSHVRILDGQVALSMSELPITGSLEAPVVLVSVSDYACRHCRDLHRLLSQWHQDQPMAFVQVHLFAPLSSECNPELIVTPPGFENSCLVVRHSLAVWQGAPRQWPAFNDWLYDWEDQPHTAAQVHAKALEILGEDRLKALLFDPAIARHLQQGIAVYRRAGADRLPMLFSPGHPGLLGAVKDREVLIQWLSEPVPENLKGSGSQSPPDRNPASQ